MCLCVCVAEGGSLVEDFLFVIVLVSFLFFFLFFLLLFFASVHVGFME